MTEFFHLEKTNKTALRVSHIIERLMQKPFRDILERKLAILGLRHWNIHTIQAAMETNNAGGDCGAEDRNGTEEILTVQTVPAYTTSTRLYFNTATKGKEILQFQLSCTHTRIPINSTYQKFSLFRQWNLFPLSIWIP